ncbi:MAG: hypothetical protein IJU35_04805 [Paludibacteraceae bacterium]|nr:hypothetical protein [Paludibacteraceae bacterium]
MKKLLFFAIATVLTLAMASCSKKDSTEDPSYNLVGSWSLTEAKATLGQGGNQIPLSASSVVLKEDHSGEIAYKNLFGTNETALFAWSVEGSQLVLNDSNNELAKLFVGLSVPSPLKFDIKNYSDNGFDVATSFTAKQGDKDVVIALTGHFTRK